MGHTYRKLRLLHHSYLGPFPLLPIDLTKSGLPEAFSCKDTGQPAMSSPVN